MVAACSTTAAGTAASPTGLTSTNASVGTPQQSVAAAPSTVFTTVTQSAITEPRTVASSSPNNSGGAAPSIYTPAPPPNQASIDGWVANFSNGAKFLGWTVTGDTVAGTYSETLLLPGATTTLTADSASLSGTISGSSVTLTFSHGFGSTVSGQLIGNTLSLSIPQTDGTLQVEVYQPGTTADYNADVQVVQARAAQLQDEAASNASVASEESASSAAAAAVQQQPADDQQSAQSVIASLTQDANFDSDLSSLAGDVKQTAEDLIQTRSDAKAGGGDNCVNASSTVYNDAATTLYNDAQTSLFNDLNSLTRDIAATQMDVDDVHSADQQLSADGIPVAADSASSINAAQGAISAAKGPANNDIDKVNAAVKTAYAIADGIATGPCFGMGPGQPPTPIPHI